MHMVTMYIPLGYVNNYDKNRCLEFFSKTAVYVNTRMQLRTLKFGFIIVKLVFTGVCISFLVFALKHRLRNIVKTA